jgi:ribosomal-protein-alanine N-acetyltransferase
VILIGDARSFLLGRVIADEAEVLTIATAPEFRRQGLAQARIAAFLDALRIQQATLVFLEVAEDNTSASALYLKAGFKVVGTRPNYYTRPSGEKIAACVMQYDLIS